MKEDHFPINGLLSEAFAALQLHFGGLRTVLKGDGLLLE